MPITKMERRIAPVYNRLINGATGEYLSSEPMDLDVRDRSRWRTEHPTIDVGALDDTEFMTAVLESSRQPLNPLRLARDALGDESLSRLEVIDGLKSAYADLLQQYAQNGVDASDLDLVWEMIGLTEAYIDGYSREIGQVATRLMIIDPKYNALERWNSQCWVPDEGMHDKLLWWLRTHLNIGDEEVYTDKHIRHNKIGNHVDMSSFIRLNGYVTLQEDSTVVSYENMVKLLGPVFGYIFYKVAANEAQHKRAYRYILLELTKEFPDESVLAMLINCDAFAMPGEVGIDGYKKMATALGRMGLLDPVGVQASQSQLIKSMGLSKLTLLSDDAERAREQLLKNADESSNKEELSKGARKRRVAATLVERARERALSDASRHGTPLPIIIGHTVDGRVKKVKGRQGTVRETVFPMSSAA